MAKTTKKDDTLIGMVKFVANVLLKDPSQIGIVLDDNGWTDVDQLIVNSNFYQQTNGYELLTKQFLDVIVARNDFPNTKFEYSQDGWRIRAVSSPATPVCSVKSPVSQMYSVKPKVDPKSPPNIQCTEIPPDLLYHGTIQSKTKPIQAEGLKKMKRTHVYLCSEEKEVLEVAVRHTPKGERAIVLTVKAKDMYLKGHKFYRAKGNVWLTDSVPSEFIVFPNNTLPKKNVGRNYTNPSDLFGEDIDLFGEDEISSEVIEESSISSED